MNVLLIGSGGREHALAWKMAQSPKLSQLYIAPGNAGTAACGVNVSLNILDFESVGKWALDSSIDLVVVGPEAPLVEGIRDYFEADTNLKNIPIIGPGKAGAELEGSKDFAKRFMARHNIPTASYATFTGEDLNEGIQFLESMQPPYVLKADGLAAGKGVLILNNLEEAKTELKAMLQDAKFGAASSQVVIESFLDGIELSVFVLTDGTSYTILPEAKDYKRIGEGDTGLNTGGMGAVSPVPFAGEDFMKKVEERVVIPTVRGLKTDGIPYIGFLFIGLMNVAGDPFVVEYNVRMGDPETEVVMPRIKSDFLQLLSGAASGELDKYKLETESDAAVTVVAVSGGYPGSYEKGKTISGLDKALESTIFHAGTKNEEESLKTNGGRVLAVTSMGASMNEAVAKSYSSLEEITFEGMYFRRDIGKDLKE